MANLQLEKYRKLLGGHTELRCHENRSLRLSLVDGQLMGNTQNRAQGISSRAFVNGAWGFASHPQLSDINVQNVVNDAVKNAKVLSPYKNSQSQLAPAHAAKHTLDLSSVHRAPSTEELVSRLKEVEAYLLATYPKVTQRSLGVMQQDFIKETLTSFDAHTYFHYARSYLTVVIGMTGAHGHIALHEVFGDKGQLADTLPTLEFLKPRLEKMYQHLLNKAEGVHAEAGIKEVILSSKMAGILAHEAIGHTTEADLVMGGSVAGAYLGREIASPKVSLVDYAHTYGGQMAPMPVYFDDEGTEASDTWIIKDGVLKTFMNSRETAHHFAQPATGHARAWGFSDEPLIRMRNTAIVPGTDRLEDMIASVDDGYFLMDHGSGQADSTSEFMFGVSVGYEIKKGKIGRGILDTTISGVAFDMLKTVSMLSNEMTWVSAGTCGKKQAMTVGMGGPALKCTVSIGGK